MAVTENDLKMFGSAVMPDDESNNSLGVGGAIDVSKKVTFMDLRRNSTATLEAASTKAADNGKTVKIYGLDSANVQRDDSNAAEIALAGNTDQSDINDVTAYVLSSPTVTFKSVDKIVLLQSGNRVKASGTIKVRTVTADNSGVEVATLEPGVTEVRKPFYRVPANQGDSANQYYEKVYIKNDNPTDHLTSATVYEQLDPKANVDFALERDGGHLQFITIEGGPTGGYFKLNYGSDPISAVPADPGFTHNATPEQIQTALRGHSAIDNATTVTGSATEGYTVNLALNDTDAIPQMLTATNTFTGGSNPDVIIGGAGTNLQDSGGNPGRRDKPPLAKVLTPGGQGVFNSNSKNVVYDRRVGDTDEKGVLGPRHYQGVWLRLTLNNNTPAEDAVYSLRITGETS